MFLYGAFLAAQGAFDSSDDIIWRTLAVGVRVVPLALLLRFVVAPLVFVVVIAPLRVVVARLLLLVRPVCHQVRECPDGLGVLPAEISIEVPVGKAVLEAVDDVLMGDVGDGGMCLEEATSVGVQGFVFPLLALG